ncbi:hypothetical protein AAMO2058_000661900 [Amorphochlora amoebiformis]
MLKKGTCRAGRGGRRVGAGRKSNFERAAARRVEAEQKKKNISIFGKAGFLRFSKRQKKMEEQEAKRQKNKHTAAGSRKPLEGGDPHEPAHDGKLEPRRPNYQGDHDDHVGHDQVNHSDDGKQEKNDYDDHVDDSDPGDYNDGDGILGNCNDRKDHGDPDSEPEDLNHVVGREDDELCIDEGEFDELDEDEDEKKSGAVRMYLQAIAYRVQHEINLDRHNPRRVPPIETKNGFSKFVPDNMLQRIRNGDEWLYSPNLMKKWNQCQDVSIFYLPRVFLWFPLIGGQRKQIHFKCINSDCENPFTVTPDGFQKDHPGRRVIDQHGNYWVICRRFRCPSCKARAGAIKDAERLRGNADLIKDSKRARNLQNTHIPGKPLRKQRKKAKVQRGNECGSDDEPEEMARQYTFLSTHPVILDSIVGGDSFPAVFSHKCGLDKTLMEALRFRCGRRIVFKEIADSLLNSHTLEYSRRKRLYYTLLAADKAKGNRTIKSCWKKDIHKKKTPSIFGYISDPERYNVVSPSYQYLARMFLRFHHRHRVALNKTLLRTLGKILKLDHSFKFSSKIFLYGNRAFGSLLTIVNENNEIVDMVLLNNKSLVELQPVLGDLARRYQHNGDLGPKVFYTDNVMDTRVLGRHFPSIVNKRALSPVVACDRGARTGENDYSDGAARSDHHGECARDKAHNSRDLKVDSEVLPNLQLPLQPVVVGIQHTEVRDKCSAIRDIILNGREGFSEACFAAFDCEWNVSRKYCSDKLFKSSRVMTLQIAVLSGQSWLFHIGRMDRKSISFIKRLLETEGVVWVGKQIGGDVHWLRSDYDIQVQAYREIGAAASHKKMARGNLSLEKLVNRILNMGLPKLDNIRVSAAWSSPKLTNEQVTYACLDAYASIKLWDEISRFDPSPLGLVENGKRVALLDRKYDLVAIGHLMCPAPVSGYVKYQLKNRVNVNRLAVVLEHIIAPGSRLEIVGKVDGKRPNINLGCLQENNLVIWETKFVRDLKDEDLKKKAGVDDLGNVDSGVDSELIPDEQSPSFPAPHHMKVSEPAYQVYLDVWHLMNRPYISKTHGAIVRFYRDMREALFCMDKIDRKSVTTVLRRKGFSDIKIKHRFYNYSRDKWIRTRVRRYHYSAHVIVENLRTVRDTYASIIDASKGSKLFNSEASRAFQTIIDAASKGLISDPKGFDSYVELGKDANSLMMYRCVRGTSQLEGIHQKVSQLFLGYICSVKMADAVAAEFWHGHNTRMRIRSGQQPNFGHYDVELERDINELSTYIWGVPEHRGWIPNDVTPIDTPTVIRRLFKNTDDLYESELIDGIKLKLPSSIDWLAKRLDVIVPPMPVITRVERRTFNGLLASMEGPFDPNHMQARWKKKVDGKHIFPKMACHLLHYYKMYQKRRNRIHTLEDAGLSEIPYKDFDLDTDDEEVLDDDDEPSSEEQIDLDEQFSSCHMDMRRSDLQTKSPKQELSSPVFNLGFTPTTTDKSKRARSEKYKRARKKQPLHKGKSKGDGDGAEIHPFPNTLKVAGRRLFRVEPDGNCLFRAIAHQTNEDFRNLRLVFYEAVLHAHNCGTSQGCPIDFEIIQSLELDEIKAMRTSGVYNSNMCDLALSFFSNGHNLNILIYDSEGYLQVHTLGSVTHVEHPEYQRVYLVKTGAHYDSTVPVLKRKRSTSKASSVRKRKSRTMKAQAISESSSNREISLRSTSRPDASARVRNLIHRLLAPENMKKKRGPDKRPRGRPRCGLCGCANCPGYLKRSKCTASADQKHKWAMTPEKKIRHASRRKPGSLCTRCTSVCYQRRPADNDSAPRGKTSTLPQASAVSFPIQVHPLRKLFLRTLSKEELKDFDSHVSQDDMTPIESTMLLCRDVKNLLPNEWLNDEVINAYIRVCSEQLQDERTMLFTSFFMTKMIPAYHLPSLAERDRTFTDQAYKRVARWWKLDLHPPDSLQFIYCPINFCDKHWALIAVNNLDKSISLFDSSPGLYSSMNMPAPLPIFLEFLAKHTGNDNYKSYRQIHAVCPRQENFNDCGVFVVAFLDCLLHGVDLDAVKQEHIDDIRKLLACTILSPKTVPKPLYEYH